MDYIKAFEEYEANKSTPARAKGDDEADDEVSKEELRVWQNQEMTQKLAKGLRQRRSVLENILMSQALKSSDPLVRETAHRIHEIHTWLGDIG